MKRLAFLKLCAFILFFLISTLSHAQNPVNWTPQQLIEPSTLDSELKAPTDSLLILSVGPGAVIPTSKNLGMASSPEGLAKLTALLKTLPKDRRIVVYCGCCPFERCPNVRPAIALLKSMQFTNYYLLNLPNNIKQDWINKGYPTAKM